MSAETEILSYSWQSLLAGSAFMVTARYLLIEIKTKRANNAPDKCSIDLSSLTKTLGSIEGICREIVDANAQILAQGNDIDECDEDIKRELERVSNLVRDLNDILRNPSSPASNVRILDKEDQIIKILNDIQIAIARMK